MNRLDTGLLLIMVGVVGLIFVFLFTRPPPNVPASFPDFPALIVWGFRYVALFLCIIIGCRLVVTTPSSK